MILVITRSALEEPLDGEPSLEGSNPYPSAISSAEAGAVGHML